MSASPPGVSRRGSGKAACATMGGGAWTAFDITGLAKQWKSGAQNGQCGFIMIGAEEETKKIGALSCEYTNSAYWPYVVVTYSLDPALNYYTYDILEGECFTLVAYDEDGAVMNNVTWTSDDVNIATVSVSGVVTGVHAGKVTITVTDSKGYSTPCVVYVKLANGVYSISNYLAGNRIGVNSGTLNVEIQSVDDSDAGRI